MKVTEDSYRIAAGNHASIAQNLVDSGQYPLASYLAGLAVECMIRAYSYRIVGEFDARHDLRLWYRRSRFDAFVPENRRVDLVSAFTIIVARWNNSQRYYSVELLKAEWKSAELDRGVRGDFVKERTRQLTDAASTIVALGETQWKNSLRRSKN